MTTRTATTPIVQEPNRFSLLPKVINGGIAGMIGVSTVFPLDLVKTRLQNQQTGPNGEKIYKSMFDCFKKTYRAEGYFGMYKGSGINIVLITPEKAIKMASNDYFRYKLMTKDGKLPVNRQMIAGGLAGLCQVSITTPMELLKIQLQNAGRLSSLQKSENKTVTKISATKIALKLFREKGIFGLYRGARATACRDISFSIIYFPLFATLNQMGPRKKDGSGDAAFFVSFAAGLAAGAVSGVKRKLELCL